MYEAGLQLKKNAYGIITAFFLSRLRCIQFEYMFKIYISHNGKIQAESQPSKYPNDAFLQVIFIAEPQFFHLQKG